MLRRGDVTTLAQATKLIKQGVEKVAVNSAVLHDMSLIRDMSAGMGSAKAWLLSIDVKKDWLGRYRVFDPASRRLALVIDPLNHALRLQEAGAGEIFLNNVMADGVQSGYDLEADFADCAFGRRAGHCVRRRRKICRTSPWR